VSRQDARHRKQVSRRRFLAWGAGGVVAAGAAAFAAVELLRGGGGSKQTASTTATTSTTTTTAPPTAETVPAGDDSALARIARRYLELTPDEAHTDVLASKLPAEFVTPAAPSWAALAQQMATDYAAGDVVAIDGWRLSRTEARAATYVALTAG
jgi:hypothetical protein